jgi:tryptophanyl-tRNA synthetase
MMNCCHFWWTCGPYKAYAAELIADFLHKHRKEHEIAREQLGEYGLFWGLGWVLGAVAIPWC